jgi:hypothetical protein
MSLDRILMCMFSFHFTLPLTFDLYTRIVTRPCRMARLPSTLMASSGLGFLVSHTGLRLMSTTTQRIPRTNPGHILSSLIAFMGSLSSAITSRAFCLRCVDVCRFASSPSVTPRCNRIPGSKRPPNFVKDFPPIVLTSVR